MIPQNLEGSHEMADEVKTSQSAKPAAEEKQAAKPAEKPAEKQADPPTNLVTVVNVSGRMKTYNLDHDLMRDHPEHGFRRLGRLRITNDPKTGDVGVLRERVSLAQSLMIPAGESVEDLPAMIGSCTEIKNAVARKEIKIVSQK